MSGLVTSLIWGIGAVAGSSRLHLARRLFFGTIGSALFRAARGMSGLVTRRIWGIGAVAASKDLAGWLLGRTSRSIIYAATGRTPGRVTGCVGGIRAIAASGDGSNLAGWLLGRATFATLHGATGRLSGHVTGLVGGSRAVAAPQVLGFGGSREEERPTEGSLGEDNVDHCCWQ
jgi:hypothetical protein